jgi:Flp pilus assembly pilin Flp
MLSRLWKEEAGAIVSAEIVLIMTILVIGMIVGLKSVRDSVVTELADVAQAFANLDQSYSFSATSGHHAYTSGASFTDVADFCDTPSNSDDSCTSGSKCIHICSATLHPAGTDGALTGSQP